MFSIKQIYKNKILIGFIKIGNEFVLKFVKMSCDGEEIGK